MSLWDAEYNLKIVFPLIINEEYRKRDSCVTYLDMRVSKTVSKKCFCHCD